MFTGASCACILWAIKGFGNGIFKKTSGINLAILIYLSAYGIANAMSANWTISFFGDYKQIGGTLSLIIYIGFFFLSVNFINSQNIKSIFKYLIITALICCIYGFFRKLGWVTILHCKLPDQPRIYSTFGSPVFFGCFLSMIVPIILYQIVSTRKFYYYPVLIILILSLFLTQTRSAIMVTILSSIPLLILYKENKKVKVITFIAFGAIFILGICLYCRPGSGLFLKIFDMNLSTYYGDRWYIYSESLKIGINHPVFGVGPDIIRPHNIFIGHFVKLGIIGFLSFCYLGYKVFKSQDTGKYKDLNLYYTLLSICLIYLTFRQFNPGYIPITLFFALIAGSIYGIKNRSY